MTLIVPDKSENKIQRTATPKWLNMTELEEAARPEKTNQDSISYNLPTNVETTVISYLCKGCNQVFSSDSLAVQKKEAARSGQTYITCPKCANSLAPYKAVNHQVKEKKHSIHHSLLDLKPGRVPNSWVDKAAYGRIVEKLGRFLGNEMGLMSPQIKFQRGVRAHSGDVSMVKKAEFTVEYYDAAGARNRILVSAQITPDGEFIAPKTFKSLGGVEYPLTIPALEYNSVGTVYEEANPYVSLPRNVYRDADPTRFPFATSRQKNKMKKTADSTMPAGIDEGALQQPNMGTTPLGGDPNSMNAMDPNSMNAVDPNAQAIQDGIGYYQDMGIDSTMAQQNVVNDLGQQGITVTPEAVSMQADQAFNQPTFEMMKNDNLIAPTSNLNDFITITKLAKYPDSESKLFNDNRVIEAYVRVPKPRADAWQETLVNTYNVALATGNNAETAILAALKATRLSTQGNVRPEVVQAMNEGLGFDEASQQVPGLSPEEWNMAADEVINQKAPGMAPTPAPGMTPGMGLASNEKTRREAVRELAKQALRDENSYVPFVQPDPDYSVAAQSDSDPDFSVPYGEGDQGISKPEDRNVNTMFRGDASTEKVEKTAEMSLLEGESHSVSPSGRDFGADFYRRYSNQSVWNDGNRWTTDMPDIGWEQLEPEQWQWNGRGSNLSDSIQPPGYNADEVFDTAQQHWTNNQSKKQVKSYDNPHDHQHPYEPSNTTPKEPDKSFEKDFTKKYQPNKVSNTLSLQKFAEPTGYNNDGKEDGWPVEYSRVQKMLESYIRQARTPIPNCDLHALKDGKYTRAEIIKYLNDYKKGEDNFVPPATATRKYAENVPTMRWEIGFDSPIPQDDKIMSRMQDRIVDSLAGVLPEESLSQTWNSGFEWLAPNNVTVTLFNVPSELTTQFRSIFENVPGVSQALSLDPGHAAVSEGRFPQQLDLGQMIDDEVNDER